MCTGRVRHRTISGMHTYSMYVVRVGHYSMTWHVRPGRLGATQPLLWLKTSLTCSLFSALFAIRFVLALVVWRGTSVRRRGPDQFWIRRELSVVIVAIVGCEVRVEWLSIVVVFSPSDSAPIGVTVSYLSQVGSTAVCLGCC